MIASICFSISTTAVMISTAISLICENSLAVLTTAKPLPPTIQYSFTACFMGQSPTVIRLRKHTFQRCHIMVIVHVKRLVNLQRIDFDCVNLQLLRNSLETIKLKLVKQ